LHFSRSSDLIAGATLPHGLLPALPAEYDAFLNDRLQLRTTVALGELGHAPHRVHLLVEDCPCRSFLHQQRDATKGQPRDQHTVSLQSDVL
jgi:hypothetical protein